MTNQPNPLPLTLPAGTRIKHLYGEVELLEPSTRREDGRYTLVRRRDVATGAVKEGNDNQVHSLAVGFSFPQNTVMLPAPPECATKGHAFATNKGECCIYCFKPRAECAVAKLCECCGIRAADSTYPIFEGAPELLGCAMACHCYEERREPTATGRLAAFANRIRARRSQLTTTPGSGEAQPSGLILCYECSEHDGLGDADMLRVVCAHCKLGEHPNKSERHWASVLCSTPACAARSVMATHGSCCVYCAHSTDDGKLQRQVVADADFIQTRDNPVNVAARARLAAMELKERPRGNPAERRMLELGHPSGWPSVGDDEP